LLPPLPSFGRAFREEAENDGPEAQNLHFGKVLSKSRKLALFWTPKPSFGMIFSRGKRKSLSRGHFSSRNRPFWNEQGPDLPETSKFFFLSDR